MSPRPTPVVHRRSASRSDLEVRRPATADGSSPSTTTTPAARRRDAASPDAPAAPAGTRAGRTRTGSSRTGSSRRRLTSRSPQPTQRLTHPPAPPRRVIGGSHRFRRPRFTWRRALAALLTIALIAGAVWAVFFSTLLTVRSIQVLGTSRQSPSGVRALLQPEIGKPLARVDLNVAAQRVVNLPTIRSVQVLRSWPNSLEVRVIERVPVAVVAAGGSYTLLDVEGIRVTSVPKAPKNLPVMTAATLNAGNGPTRAVVESLSQLTPALRAKVRTAEARTPDSVTLTLTSGAVVKWGSSEDSERKAEVLAVLLSKVKAKTYDVSAPGTPVTK